MIIRRVSYPKRIQVCSLVVFSVSPSEFRVWLPGVHNWYQGAKAVSTAVSLLVSV
jgi:hypothetical protein